MECPLFGVRPLHQTVPSYCHVPSCIGTQIPSPLLAVGDENPPVTDGFPHKGPVMRKISWNTYFPPSYQWPPVLSVYQDETPGVPVEVCVHDDRTLTLTQTPPCSREPRLFGKVPEKTLNLIVGYCGECYCWWNNFYAEIKLEHHSKHDAVTKSLVRSTTKKSSKICAEIHQSPLVLLEACISFMLIAFGKTIQRPVIRIWYALILTMAWIPRTNIQVMHKMVLCE